MIVLLSSLYLITVQDGNEYSRIALFTMGGFYGIIVVDKDMTGKVIEGVPIVYNAEEAAEFLCQSWVDEVFINLDEKCPYPKELIERCFEMGLTVHLNFAKVKDSAMGKQSVGSV